MTRAAVLLAGVVLTTTMTAGCLGPVGEDDEARLGAYHMVLHPVNYTWNPENRTLSGNITISNVNFHGQDEATRARGLQEVDLRIAYKPDRSFHPAGAVASWWLEYDVWQNLPLAPGETWVGNFSVTPEASVETVRAVVLSVAYKYPAVSADGSDPEEDMDVIWHGPCLVVQGDRLVGWFEKHECKPYKVDVRFNSRYDMDIDWISFPPVEYWDEWEEMPAELQPVHRFLENFSYNEANITYFEGEVFGADN